MPFISDTLMHQVVQEGTLIGKQEPTAESKYMYYAVYKYLGNFYAIVFSDGAECGELIAEDQISRYI